MQNKTLLDFGFSKINTLDVPKNSKRDYKGAREQRDLLNFNAYVYTKCKLSGNLFHSEEQHDAFCEYDYCKKYRLFAKVPIHL